MKENNPNPQEDDSGDCGVCGCFEGGFAESKVSRASQESMDAIENNQA